MCFVVKQVPPHLSLRTLKLCNARLAGTEGFLGVIRRIVVVAHDGEYTVSCAEARKEFLKRREFVGRGVYKVSREDDEIGLKGVHLTDESVDVSRVASERAKVEVAQLDDFIALKTCGQVRQGGALAVHFQALPSPDETVECHAKGERSNDYARPRAYRATQGVEQSQEFAY